MAYPRCPFSSARQISATTNWIAVGFTYQAAFTDGGELVLAYPYSPKETEAFTNAGPVREGMNLALATPQRMLWE